MNNLTKKPRTRAQLLRSLESVQLDIEDRQDHLCTSSPRYEMDPTERGLIREEIATLVRKKNWLQFLLKKLGG